LKLSFLPCFQVVSNNFLTFIDHFSRKTHVYLLKAKGEAFEKFKKYKTLVESEIGQKIKVL